MKTRTRSTESSRRSKAVAPHKVAVNQLPAAHLIMLNLAVDNSIHFVRGKFHRSVTLPLNKHVLDPFRQSLDLEDAAAIALVGFAVEDVALIQILKRAQLGLPGTESAQIIIGVGMFVLIMLENYILARIVVNAVKNSVTKSHRGAHVHARKVSTIFGLLDDEQSARIAKIKNPILRLIRGVTAKLNPLNLIKIIAEAAGSRLVKRAERMQEHQQSNEATLTMLWRAKSAKSVSELGLVNMIGVPWATMEIIKNGGSVSRRDALRLATLFSATWVVGAAIVQAIDGVPYVGASLNWVLHRLGELIDPFHPFDLPLGPLGTALVLSMAIKGIMNAREANQRLRGQKPDRLIRFRNRVYSRLVK